MKDRAALPSRAAFVLLLIACAANAAPSLSKHDITGDWYAEGNRHIFAIKHIRSDGTFRVEFRECLKPLDIDHLEQGHWTITNRQVIETTEVVRNRRVHLVTISDPVSVRSSSLLLRVCGGDALAVFGPQEFKLVRVTSDSKLPGCDLTS